MVTPVKHPGGTSVLKSMDPPPLVKPLPLDTCGVSTLISSGRMITPIPLGRMDLSLISPPTCSNKHLMVLPMRTPVLLVNGGDRSTTSHLSG